MDSFVKYCPRCKQTKSVQEFNKHKNRYDGLSSWCKCCFSEYRRLKRADPEVRKRQSIYLQKWYIEHKSEILVKDKKYYIENRERILENNRQYYKNNKEKVNTRIKNYYIEHPDKRQMYTHQYYLEHPEKSREKIRRRNSRKRELPWDFTTDDEKFALNYWDNKCAICGKNLDLTPASRGHAKWAFDHWIAQNDKRENNPGTVPMNMIPVCHGIGSCNLSKGTTDPIDWVNKKYPMNQAKEIIEKIQVYFSIVYRKGK